MTHTGHLRRRNWRPDDNQNRAYPSRQTVQPDGSTSFLQLFSVGAARGENVQAGYPTVSYNRKITLYVAHGRLGLG